MSNLEIKGALAKLLATENLIVQHDSNAETASFNTATRILTLPLLNIDDPHVYDMFIGHEVGHALWTPTDWAEQVDSTIPFDFVNVIEDVRIERMIQDKFPGLRSDFSKGYNTLNNRDFFAIADKDLKKLNFIDRINLHFKLGDLALIPFTNEELVYVRAVEDADSFDKVCLVSKMIADFVNAKAKQDDDGEEQVEAQSSPDGKESPDAEDTESDKEQQSQTKPDEGEGDKEQQEVPPTGKQGGETTSQTQSAFDDNLKQEVDHRRVNYIETPTQELKVVSIDDLRSDFIRNSDNYKDPIVKERFAKFMSSIKKDVNFMVQQFEMKKSADAYSRTQINKTGVLDTEKLAQFKLTDDIFLRQSITPEGKNHGLVMYLDWSGSMSETILSTVKQLLVLVQFCRKVNIPYDVYTFTCTGYGVDGDATNAVENQVIMEFNHTVVNVLSSSVSRKNIELDMFHLFSAASRIENPYVYALWSDYLAMGGTPLNNLLFAVPQLIKDFKAKTGAQKVSFVCLTDGDSSPLHFYKNAMSFDGNRYLRPVITNRFDTTFLRDGNNTYQLDSREETPSIIKWLSRKLPEVTFTNIFLSGPKGAETYHKRLSGKKLDLQQFRKTGAHAFTTDGWPLVCIVNPNMFKDADDELQCQDGATKAQVKTALKKFLKTKQTAKVLLTQLVQQFS